MTCFLVFALFLPASVWGRAGAELPFRVGERLVFAIGWAGIHAGTAELAVDGEEEFEGVPVLRLTSKARSAPFISQFYPVEDRAESLWDPVGGFSRFYQIHQREGRYRRKLRILLDQEENIALYYRNLEPGRAALIPYGVQDALSSLYKFRTFSSSVGSRHIIPTFASRKHWDVEVQVQGREVIETPWGGLPALRVKPDLRYEGLFRHRGEILFWVTDDRYRVPIRMTSQVVIGHFTATLIEAYHLKEDSLLARAILEKGRSPLGGGDEAGKGPSWEPHPAENGHLTRPPLPRIGR